MLATPLRRAFAAALLVLAATALIIAIAQVISAQEGGDDSEVGGKHSCWDHWLCDQHTPTPVPPPTNTPVPYCDLYPSCLDTPVPPTAVPPTDPPPPTDTPVPPPTNMPRPPIMIAPAPTDTPIPPTATPRPTNTPRPTSTPRPTNTLTSTPTPEPTPTLPDPVLCPGSRSETQPRVPSHQISIVDLSSVMEEGECDEVRISVPGEVLEDVDYTVTLRTDRGLYFDSSCSGASNQSREWHLSGRSRYERVYAVWACEGHTAGSMYVELRDDDDPEDFLSNAIRSVRIVTPTPTPTPTTGPTTPPTPRPTPPAELILPNPADGDLWNMRRSDCRDIYQSTDLYDTDLGYHGRYRYLARSSIYGGWVPTIGMFILSRHMPSILTYCAIGFGHHVTLPRGYATSTASV